MVALQINMVMKMDFNPKAMGLYNTISFWFSRKKGNESYCLLLLLHIASAVFSISGVSSL